MRDAVHGRDDGFLAAAAGEAAEARGGHRGAGGGGGVGMVPFYTTMKRGSSAIEILGAK